MWFTALFFLMSMIARRITCFEIISKVIIPSVYREWDRERPVWASDAMQKKFNYSVFLYQKTNSSAANYISTNRGTEAGVYLKYIVDHYDNFPNVAVFVHSDPEKHAKGWLDKIQCLRPNVTYFNFNDYRLCRKSTAWEYNSVWMEQCWRDVLKVVWDDKKYSRFVLLHSSYPITVCTQCCQQFVLGRSMVRARPLSVWKQLLRMIGENSVCHAGPLNLGSLQSAKIFNAYHAGPEDTIIEHNGHGQLIQGGTMEHLAHVVYGQQPLITPEPDMAELCRHFQDQTQCPGSPCREGEIVTMSPSVSPSVRPTMYPKNRANVVEQAGRRVGRMPGQ